MKLSASLLALALILAVAGVDRLIARRQPDGAA
jgi:hypothetical protein